MISPGTDASGVVVAEHGALDLARLRHRRLDDDLAVEARRRAPSPSRSSAASSPSRCRRSIRGSPASRTSGSRSAVSRSRGDRVARRAASRAAARRGRGRPAGRARRTATFITALSMPTAEASTPAPTYGTLASSSSPWTVPSSPYGPCSTGKMTSRSSPVTTAPALGVAAARAVDREDRLVARARDEVHLAPFAASAARPRAAPARSLRRRHRRRRLVGERPAAVLLDADRHRLVAGRDRDSRTPPRPTRATLRARRIGRRRCTPTRRRFTQNRIQETGQA